MLIEHIEAFLGIVSVKSEMDHVGLVLELGDLARNDPPQCLHFTLSEMEIQRVSIKQQHFDVRSVNQYVTS